MSKRSPLLRGLVYVALSMALVACDDGDSPAVADGGAGGTGGMAGAGGTGGAGGMQMGVGVSDPAARACEAVFTASPAAAVSVSFGSDVTGTWRRREDRVAVGFFHRNDDAFPEGALSVAGVETPPTTVRCYDRLGAPLAGAELILE